MNRDTVFSPCRLYRYTLWREISSDELLLFADPYSSVNQDRYVQFVGLNPSTADERLNDPTIRRCIDFARRWGFGALCMTNAFAWRDTDPEQMKKVPEPIGESNTRYLLEMAKGAGLVVLAWGKDGRHKGRDKEILELFSEAKINVHCLAVNDDGTPKHPLYIKGTTKPQPYPIRA